MNPRALFATSFACILGFTLVLFAFVYAAIPSLSQVVPAAPNWPGIAHWSKDDIAGAILGNYMQRWYELPILLLTCAAAALLPTRLLLVKQQQKAALYDKLTEAYGHHHGLEAERRRLKEALASLAPQVRALTERLGTLERRLSHSGDVLDRGEYETAHTPEPKNMAHQFRNGLEALESELVLATTALQQAMDAPPASPHADMAERLKRFSLNAALAANNTDAPLAADARALADDLERMLLETPALPEGLNAAATHLRTATELLDDQWMLITSMNSDDTGASFSEALGALTRQAGELEEKILHFTAASKQKAA